MSAGVVLFLVVALLPVLAAVRWHLDPRPTFDDLGRERLP